jgi:uncharacterized protein (DUF433 family)
MANTKLEVKHAYVVKDLKIHGGEPIIKGTRFPVRSVVTYILKNGMLPEELVSEFPQLKIAAIYDALSYYYDHKDEVEKLIAGQKEDVWKDKVE